MSLIRLWRALLGKKTNQEPAGGAPTPLSDTMPLRTASSITSADNIESPAATATETQKPQTLKVSASQGARNELAMSFVDLLLENNAQHDLDPNDAERFILEELERLLSHGVPDSIVPQMPEVAATLLRELSDSDVS